MTPTCLTLFNWNELDVVHIKKQDIGRYSKNMYLYILDLGEEFPKILIQITFISSFNVGQPDTPVNSDVLELLSLA